MMVECLIQEHPNRDGGFIVDVYQKRKADPLHRGIVCREFKLGDRNNNFARALDFARSEMADACRIPEVTTKEGAE